MDLPEPFVKTLKQWIEVFMRGSMHNFLLFSKQHGFSMTQIAVMFMLRRKGVTSVSVIAGELQISNAAASQLLDRLVQQGLLIRSEDPRDRRLKQIALSEKGYASLQEGLQARQRWLEDLVGRLSQDERIQVINALDLLIDKALQIDTSVSQTAYP